ncbi:MAG: hypothetical protein RLZZ517_623 [Candidatus Parcubacteria bacterium]|jgi:hypothetical protein
MSQNFAALAEQNLDRLLTCSYFGRAIFAAVSESGNHVYLATAISGRSPGSQNRRYVFGTDATVRTEQVDTTQGVGDADLTLYPTQAERHNRIFAISNGSQTTMALEARLDSTLLGGVLTGFKHEPDDPILTNRITATCQLIRGQVPEDQIVPMFEFVTHSPNEDGSTLISLTTPEQIKPGYAKFLATYDGDGSKTPLRFEGGPRILWTSAINSLENLVAILKQGNDYLVAVSFKKIDLKNGRSETRLWNRHGDKPAI